MSPVLAALSLVFGLGALGFAARWSLRWFAAGAAEGWIDHGVTLPPVCPHRTCNRRGPIP